MKTVTIALTIALAACHPEVELGGGYRTLVDVPPEPIDDLDILFVIDNSGSMAVHQQALVASAGESLFAQLAAELDGLPDIHVAVISSDLGAGAYNISGCSGVGDGGRFQAVPRSGCTPPSGTFISDVDDGSGGRITNYVGSLSDVFACIAPLGIDGCGFEQPLESMRRALDGSNSENAGFLRDEALLLVVIVSDEDDCSTYDNGVFDTQDTSLTGPLGPISSFRCFEFGTVCDGDDPRTLGVKFNCAPRLTSQYLTPPSEYVTFLQGLKDHPSNVMLAGILGGLGPVAVELDDSGFPRLADICGGANGRVDPTPRLHAVLEAFPARYDFEPICGISYANSLARIAHRTAGVMSGSLCLAEEPFDTDANTPGLQARCRAFDVGAGRTEIRSCAESRPPCFELVTDASECGYTESQLRIDVQRTAPRPDGTRFIAECVVAPATPE